MKFFGFFFFITLMTSASVWAGQQLHLKAVVDKGCTQSVSFDDLILEQNELTEKCKGVDSETSFTAATQGQTEIGQHQLLELARNWIKQCQILSGEKIEFILPERVQLNLMNHSDSPTIMNRARDILKMQFPDVTLFITKVSIPQFSCEELKEVSFNSAVLDGHGAFSISANTKKETKWVTGQYSLRRTVATATRPLNAGEKIQAQDIEMKDMDVTQIKERLVPDIQAIGQVVTRSMSAGQVLTAGYVKPEPAVMRGQIIRVRIGNDSFEVLTSGVAEQQGYIGDTIQFRNQETKKIMSGLITERGLVEVK